MAKFHVNRKGVVDECQATEEGRGCPFGDPEKDHYPTREEAQRAYEARMETFHTPALEDNPDVFVSVLASDGDVLTERFAPDLGRDLEPGRYMVTYRRPDTQKDQLARLTVRPDGSVKFEEKRAFISLKSPSRKKTQAAAQRAKSRVVLMAKKCLPHEASGDALNRTTLGELTNEFHRTLVRHDWSTAEGAQRGRQELEDLEWSIDHDLEIARKQPGAEGDVRALEEAKGAVGELLDALLSRD